MVDRRSSTKLAERMAWITEELSLASLPLLQNVFGALNALGQAEQMSVQYIDVAKTVAPGATATLLDIHPPLGQLALWQSLRIQPAYNTAFTVVVTADGHQVLNDSATVGFWLVPVWAGIRGFVNEYKVVVTNNSALTTYSINLYGPLYFVKHDLGTDIKNAIQAGINATLVPAGQEEW